MAEQNRSTLCPDCGRPIQPGSPMVICGECGMLHHAACWRTNRGCKSFAGGAALARGAAPGEDEATEQEKGFLTLVFKRSHPTGRFTVVSPYTVDYPFPRGGGDAGRVAERKKYIADWFLRPAAEARKYASFAEYARDHLRTEDREIRNKEWLQARATEVVGLVDRLFERNTKPVRLSLESSPKDGYVIDDGRYQKYFEEGGGGWDKFYDDDPRLWGMTEVMLPVHDQTTGLVLVYQGTRLGPQDGRGAVVLHRYEKGKLDEIDQVEMWAS